MVLPGTFRKHEHKPGVDHKRRQIEEQEQRGCGPCPHEQVFKVAAVAECSGEVNARHTLRPHCSKAWVDSSEGEGVGAAGCYRRGGVRALRRVDSSG